MLYTVFNIAIINAITILPFKTPQFLVSINKNYFVIISVLKIQKEDSFKTTLFY
jgi:hypothetical protein